MKIRKLHKWDLSYSHATALQRRLAGKVMFTPVRKQPKLIAGLDCAFAKDGKRIVAAVVVVKLPDLEVVDTRIAVRKVTFPYIPGLLSFRESPACIASVEKLRSSPDVFIIDGQGIAHPRRLGIAAHLGLFFDRPTIGCAKSRLIGSFTEPPLQKGSFSLLKDHEEVIGAVLRTRSNVKPLFVSVGHKCTLEDAIQIILACTTRFRLPEPARLAHRFVTKAALKESQPA